MLFKEICLGLIQTNSMYRLGCCFLFVFFLGMGSLTHAQDSSRILEQLEEELAGWADSMYNAMDPTERDGYNERFIRGLVQALKEPNSFQYPFEKLTEHINILYPDDRSFRIFNWALAPTPVTRRYYGAIQKAGEELQLYPLIDYSNQMKEEIESMVLRDGKWFGVLYYRILTNDWNGQKMYTLLGLNASSPISNIKVAEPMIFEETGPVFGAPVFNIRSTENPEQRIHRFHIEYKKEVSASMNWDDEMKLIYFDLLESSVNDPHRKYTYVPTGQIDGLRWNRGVWNYVHDLIPIDPRTDGNAPAPIPIKEK